MLEPLLIGVGLSFILMLLYCVLVPFIGCMDFCWDKCGTRNMRCITGLILSVIIVSFLSWTVWMWMSAEVSDKGLALYAFPIGYLQAKLTVMTIFIFMFIILVYKQNKAGDLKQFLHDKEGVSGYKYGDEMSGLKRIIHSHKDRQYVEDLVYKTWLNDERLGSDSCGLGHTSIRVKNLFRLNNETLWKRYIKTLAEPNSLYTTTNLLSELLEKSVLSKSITGPNPAKYNLPLRENEMHLFCGTTLYNLQGIAENGFQMSNRTGLYSKAVYLSESSDKADQHTDARNKRATDNLLMIIVRVNLGRIHVHTGPGEPQFVNGVGYDTVVAGLDKRFREFLLYDTNRCYPEYLVLYDRVQEEDIV